MSALAERISNEMKAALLGGDRFRGDVLRNLNAAILNEEVDKGVRETGLDDESIEKLIAREVKRRQESAVLYRENDRNDLAEPEEKEAEILQEFLPEQLGEAEIESVVDEVISSMGDIDMKQMGQVIGAVKSKLGNSADGSLVAKIVKSKLSN